MVKIQSNPSVNAWLQNPQKVSLLNELQKNPNKLFDHQSAEEDASTLQKIVEILGSSTQLECHGFGFFLALQSPNSFRHLTTMKIRLSVSYEVATFLK